MKKTLDKWTTDNINYTYKVNNGTYILTKGVKVGTGDYLKVVLKTWKHAPKHSEIIEATSHRTETFELEVSQGSVNELIDCLGYSLEKYSGEMIIFWSTTSKQFWLRAYTINKEDYTDLHHIVIYNFIEKKMLQDIIDLVENPDQKYLLQKHWDWNNLIEHLKDDKEPNTFTKGYKTFLLNRLRYYE